MSLKYVTRFNVVGSISFPMDMLRHDRCFPSTSGDAAVITDSVEEYTQGTKTVTLITYHESKLRTGITDGRWMSFSWPVDPNSIDTTKI